MNEPLGVSIIVVNYNNEQFLAAAIDSALAQQHPLCEVIVVDDCSTDNSRAVIARYGGRIRRVLREANGGQTAALNSAWPLARYPILIFLDSDDLLLPHAAASVADIWRSATAKAHFPLASIDKAGRQFGHVAPKYRPNLDTAKIRTELLRTGQSPCSPGSGNAYSRSILERIRVDGGFDLENPREYWMDSIMECNAPFYGEIETIYEPLAYYRIHDNNLFLPNTIDKARFSKMSHTFTVKLDYLALRCRTWGIAFDSAAARDRSLYFLQCRLAAGKLASPKDQQCEPIHRTLGKALKACIDTPVPMLQRVVLMVWFASVAVAPRALARQLIALRFMPSIRPPWFDRLFINFKTGGWRGSPRSHATKHGRAENRPRGWI